VTAKIEGDHQREADREAIRQPASLAKRVIFVQPEQNRNPASPTK
jgi:hypothetical protein